MMSERNGLSPAVEPESKTEKEFGAGACVTVSAVTGTGEPYGDAQQFDDGAEPHHQQQEKRLGGTVEEQRELFSCNGNTQTVSVALPLPDERLGHSGKRAGLCAD